MDMNYLENHDNPKSKYDYKKQANQKKNLGLI